MSKQSKYELASPEVQEVVTRPPHLLILWGNSFILLIIAVCLVLLNTITIPRYLWLAYKVESYGTGKIAVAIRKDVHSLPLQSKTLQLPVADLQSDFQSFRIEAVTAQ